MELKKAEQLIKKYHKGETSLEEELHLKDFLLNTKALPEHLQAEKELFILFNHAAEEYVPIPDFMENLEEIIDNQAKIKNLMHRPVYKWISGIAAGIALLICVYFIFHTNKTNDITGIAFTDTYDDPQLAYEETQKVLLYISQNINKGTRPLSNFNKIEGSVQPLQNFEKMEEGIDELQILQFLKYNDNTTTK